MSDFAQIYLLIAHLREVLGTMGYTKPDLHFTCPAYGASDGLTAGISITASPGRYLFADGKSVREIRDSAVAKIQKLPPVLDTRRKALLETLAQAAKEAHEIGLEYGDIANQLADHYPEPPEPEPLPPPAIVAPTTDDEGLVMPFPGPANTPRRTLDPESDEDHGAPFGTVATIELPPTPEGMAVINRALTESAQKPGTYRISPYADPDTAKSIREAIGGTIPEDPAPLLGPGDFQPYWQQEGWASREAFVAEHPDHDPETGEKDQPF